MYLPYDLFVSHLDYLQRRRRVISLGEYVAARRQGRRLPDYTVVLTFDDGARNFLTVVAPLLAGRALTAAAFVISEYAEARQNSAFPGEWTPIDDYLYLSWEEVRRLAEQPGIEIGSHGHTHLNLTAVNAEEARRELRESLAAVAEHTGNVSPALSYPHGMTNGKVREAAASLGYACAVTGELRMNDDRTDLFSLGRIVIAEDDDLATFEARVSGVTWLYHHLVGAVGRWMTSRRTARASCPCLHETEGLVQIKNLSSEETP